MLKSQVGDDPAIVSEFLASFQKSARHMATELKAANALGDLRQIADIAHKLKSASRSIGALAFGDLCAALENACRSGAREGAAEHVLRFEADLVAVEAQIGAHLAVS